MTKIYTFYKDLINSNGYTVRRSELGTGSTSTGIQQNAIASVEANQYLSGSPGPYTEIKVNLSRMYLNEPITVRVRFTTYAFKGFSR